MGLFSSKKKISVATAVNRVIEDRLLPNSPKIGTIRGILSDDQLVENIMEEMVSSIGTRAERMYQYGKRAYPYGVPTSHIFRNSDSNAILLGVLTQLEGTPVFLEYANYGFLNSLHYGWTELISSYGYNIASNQLAVLSAAKGYPVYLADMQVVVPAADLEQLTLSALAQHGTAAQAGVTPTQPIVNAAIPVAHTPIAGDAEAANEYLQVTVAWTGANRTQHTETFTFPTPDEDESTEYFQAKYYYNVPSGLGTWAVDYNINPLGEMVFTPGPPIRVYKYFTYREGEGSWPELDEVYTPTYNELGSFFPFGYFRYNHMNTGGNAPGTPEYKAQVKLMSYLGMNYAKVSEAINTNPDVEHVESALLMMVVPASTGNQVELRYLFDFFKGIYVKTGLIDIDPVVPKSLDSQLAYENLYQKETTDAISMVIRDARFVTTLGMTGIYRHVRAGVLGAIGTYACTQDEVVTTHTGTTFAGEGLEPTPYSVEIKRPYHIYKKQITASMYEEIQVFELRMTYEMNDGYITANSMVPIDRSITKNYPAFVREELYARSLHYIINSRQETKISWYAQAWFRVVLIIIAIVITILDWGSDGGSVLAAAIAAGTVTLEMVVVAIIVAAIEALIIRLVAKLFVKLLGPEFAMLVALVVAVYSISNLSNTNGAPWAKDLLALSNSMVSTVGENYNKALEGIKTESDEFQLFAKGKADELKAVKEEMEGSLILSPFTIFGEKPQDYYNRTVHTGNIGIRSLDAITNYCDIALTLPTITQTILDEG